LKCPRCGREDLNRELALLASCPACGFSGPLTQVEELAHVRYLLGELAGWRELSSVVREQLQARYLRRRRELEIELELRPPPLSPEAARQAVGERLCLRQLLTLLSEWVERGWIKPDAAETLATQSQERIEELCIRLSEPDTPSVPAFDSPAERVALLKSLRDELDRLHQEGGWVDGTAYRAATGDLGQRVEQLEIELGLRHRPRKKPRPEPVKEPAYTATPEPAAPPRKPVKKTPLTWERVWRTLLSERTLRVLLFVGVFLLFASAVTLVAYNWERFPPLVQVAFLIGFTLFFYGLGWYVRVKMGLRDSGIALSATGSLLVPVDFYAIYLSGGIFPPEAWAEVWLAASAVCLVVYTLTAVMLHAEFFGYLVGTAAGSTLCAALQVTGVSSDWWTPTLIGLALLLTLLSWWKETRFFPKNLVSGFQAVFERPFRHLALLTVTTVLLLVTGLHIAGRFPRPALRLALAFDWWLACGVYTLAAARYPRRTLTSAACITAPVAIYLTLVLRFEVTGAGPAWYALGWALLTPVYLALGWVLQGNLTQVLPADKGRQAQGRTLVRWAIALVLLATGWGFGDMPAAAAAHGVLTGSVVLAVVLWQRPGLLPIVSLFSLSTATTWMATLGLDLAQYSLGWALLAILYTIVAVLLRQANRYTPSLYAASWGIAVLSLLPPLVTLDQDRMTYALGNWIALSGWAAWLAHGEEHPGLRQLLRLAGPLRRSVLHWATALPLPVWFWLAWANVRVSDTWLQLGVGLAAIARGYVGLARCMTWINARSAYAWLGVGFAALAWVCLGLGRRLARHEKAYGPPWYTVSFIFSALGPAVAGGYYDQPFLAATLLSGAALYFLYTYLFRSRWWLLVGGLTFPFGYILALDHLGLPPDPLAASLALVPAAYVLVSLWLERHRQVAASFLEPLYGVTHIVAIYTFLWGFGGLWDYVVQDVPWTDVARLWAASGQLLLGVTYGLAAWYLEEQAWGYVAAWLGVVAGGLVATVYSQGRGSSAAKAALLAVLYVLAERVLHALRERHPLPRKAWSLYRKPLLVAGWAVSGGAVLLALVRNLNLPGDELMRAVREDWAIVGLLLVVALYAISARLFRRPLFLWLAAPLIFAPWTLLTHRGWYVWSSWAPPPAPRYALAWVVLAWGLVLAGLLLDSRAGKWYGLPLRTTAHVLLPFALLWGGADPSTSSATCGLGLVFYVLAAITDHRRGRTGMAAARFLYLAALLAPVWAVYLLAWQKPGLPHAHFGLLLILLSPLLFAIARRLRHVHSADALPAYLTSYGCAIVGTMLVSYEQPLLALALLFDAGLALVSARLLREPLWVYPAAALPPAALLLALAEAGFDPHRRGWWLIGLGAVYLAQAWALRRLSFCWGRSPTVPPLLGLVSDRVSRYATPLMAAAYAVVALGLPLSSYKQTAAFWAYGAAALIYALSAAWLREPLLLMPTVALSGVPYAIALDRVTWIAPANYGLALWPGIVASLLVAHLLDRAVGAPRDFPWDRPARWLPEAARRLTSWWGLPFYLGGYLGAFASAALSWDHPGQLVMALALAAVAYGLATWRFRLRGWLLVAAATAQAGALAVIWAAAEGVFPVSQAWVTQLGYPAWRALVFLPVTLVTAVAGLVVERRRGEGSPFAGLRALWEGWSRPLYWLLALDLLVVQITATTLAHPGALISMAHALLLATLAVVWSQPFLPYLAAGLGLLAVIQRLFWVEAPNTDAPVALAALALGYGLVGYGLEYIRTLAKARVRVDKVDEKRGISSSTHSSLTFDGDRVAVLERPLEQAGLVISAAAVLGTMALGLRIPRWLARALLGRPLMTPDDVPVVQMGVAVLALVGLLYLAAALVRRWYWRGYGAVALLLCAWGLEWFLVWDLREVQWYTIPAGLYLLCVGYLEWRQGRKGMARWIDRAALLLLLGSSFYQSLAEQYGWSYALLMGAESLFLIWWGSARRQRRLLYFGLVGVVTDVGGQLIEPLLSINRWIVFGGVGLVVIAVAILVERSLETVKRVSQEWQERLEEWE